MPEILERFAVAASGRTLLLSLEGTGRGAMARYGLLWEDAPDVDGWHGLTLRDAMHTVATVLARPVEPVDDAPLPGGDPLTFVTWKWRGTDSARQFHSAHVNVLAAMLARHYHAPSKLVCLTDDAQGLDSSIEAWPLPETKADHLGPPRQGASKLFPACYRRLWLFSDEAKALGRRICLLDIDVIILQDITALLHRKQADFVAWCDPLSFQWNKIAGGFWMLNTGTHPEVWNDFDPETSPLLAYDAGYHGSDQSWLSLKLYPPKQYLGAKDGIVKLGWLPKNGRHPDPHIKLVFTTGVRPTWDDTLQAGCRWIRQHWRLE